MDGALNERQVKLLARLAARTNRDGTPKRNYEENVATIRAELAVMESRINYIARMQETPSGDQTA